MKINLIVSLILFLSFFPQEKPLSEVVYINPPKKSERITWLQQLSYVKDNYQTSPTLDNTAKCFNTSGIITTFWDVILDSDYLKTMVKTLPEIKASTLEAIEELGMSEDIDRAEIIKVNGIGFFVSCTHIDNEYRYTFDSEYRNYKSISGKIVCKKQDREKAGQIFNALLKSIKFK